MVATKGVARGLSHSEDGTNRPMFEVSCQFVGSAKIGEPGSSSRIKADIYAFSIRSPLTNRKVHVLAIPYQEQSVIVFKDNHIVITLGPKNDPTGEPTSAGDVQKAAPEK